MFLGCDCPGHIWRLSVLTISPAGILSSTFIFCTVSLSCISCCFSFPSLSTALAPAVSPCTQISGGCLCSELKSSGFGGHNSQNEVSWRSSLAPNDIHMGSMKNKRIYWVSAMCQTQFLIWDLASPLYRWRNWGSGRLNDLSSHLEFWCVHLHHRHLTMLLIPLHRNGSLQRADPWG